MTNRLILLVLVVSMNCFGQEAKNDNQISFGLYGIVYPYNSYTHFHSGALLDFSLKNRKRLSLSSSVNYTGYYRNSYQNHNLSIGSGLSWKILMKNLSFRPGIQVGYFHQSKFATTYTYHAFIGRLSSELTHVINSFEYGLHYNFGIGYGKEINSIESQSRYKMGAMTGFGVVLKYTLL